MRRLRMAALKIVKPSLTAECACAIQAFTTR
jgi:hypothetical protein